MNAIPIGDARRIAEERHLPIVLVFGLNSSGHYALTTYGQTRRLCAIAKQIGDGIVKAMEEERVLPE